ncbi:MAG TPA: hypothetical protein PLD25_20140 [Chloroflexota bacterium]|nr:hypothetical protein [Chloroflexota bacterium]HUM68439.1 hypothetical protein [Chloroflexota bacterium]
MTQNNDISTMRPRPRPTARRAQPRRPREALSDEASGQLVVVAARWVLVVAGLFLVMWNPDALDHLRFQVGILLLLAVANFYLHAQLLMRRPTLQQVVLAASAFDIAAITLLVATQGGFTSNTFIFYFPALLAISVAFPMATTLIFGAGVISIYAAISLSSSFLSRTVADDAPQILVVRLLMLAAVVACGVLYQHVEAQRRQAAEWAQQDLLEEMQQRQEMPEVVDRL